MSVTLYPEHPEVAVLCASVAFHGWKGVKYDDLNDDDKYNLIYECLKKIVQAC